MLRIMTGSVPLLHHLAKRMSPHLRGRLAEKVALVSYRLRGFRPLTVPQALAQTDLTLRRGQLVLLVEVKYRTTQERAHMALTPAQRQRLVRQARAVAALYGGCTVRVEMCLVFPRRPFLQCIPLLDN